MGNAKLKFSLTLILLIFAIVPALVVGAVGTFSIIGYEKNAKLDTLKTVSLSKSSAVDQIFTDYVSVTSTLSKLEPVIKTASEGGDAADSILDAFDVADKDIIDILIIGSSGNILASGSGSMSGSFEHFNADGMPAVSPLKSWESYKTDAFFVSKPIYADPDTKTGGELGYVCAVISVAPDSGIGKALSGTYLNGAHLVLLDEDGNAVNFAGDGAVTKEGSFGSAKDDIFANTGNVTDINGYDTMYTAGMSKYEFSAGIIPNVTSWRWVGVADSGKFGTFAASTNLIGWGVIAVACIIVSLIAMVIIARFIGKIHDMLKTMSAIANDEGGTEIRFDVKKGKSELDDIQRSFNDMLDEIYLSEERHRTISELSDNMLFEWDFHKEFMYVSPNTLAKFNLRPADSTLSNGRFIDSLMSQEDAERYKRDINSLLKNKNSFSAEYQLTTVHGTVIWVLLRAVCITDRLGEPLRVIGVMTDIDNEKKMELQLSERASYDFLSQLYNRNTFIRTFTSELERRGQNKVGAMFLDVDDFKFINDRYGHSVGDEVIRFVADTIRTKVDDRGGFAGRFGGDEFVLCYTNQEDIANLENIAMDIIDQLNNGYVASDGTMINVKISIGIAYCPEHSDDANELLSFADTAMYFVKKNGKMNYHVYMPEDSASGEYVDPEGYYSNGVPEEAEQ